MTPSIMVVGMIVFCCRCLVRRTILFMYCGKIRPPVVVNAVTFSRLVVHGAQMRDRASTIRVSAKSGHSVLYLIILIDNSVESWILSAIWVAKVILALSSRVEVMMGFHAHRIKSAWLSAIREPNIHT